jgi:hypothetical protein
MKNTFKIHEIIYMSMGRGIGDKKRGKRTHGEDENRWLNTMGKGGQ